MGAAIVRPPNTQYTQNIGACWETLPKLVRITLLQFNYEFSHGILFSQYDLHNIFTICINRKKKILTETRIIKLQSCHKFPVFVMFACFPFK